jgi:hypothetical protein
MASCVTASSVRMGKVRHSELGNLALQEVDGASRGRQAVVGLCQLISYLSSGYKRTAAQPQWLQKVNGWNQALPTLKHSCKIA